MASPIISVRGLVKRYKKAPTQAVDNISFSVSAGEFFALLGPNGAGKTTTISILTTTLSKTSGDVSISGFDIDKHSSEVRQRVGIIFQNPSLDLNLTAEENIRFHAALYNLYPYRPFYSMMPDSYKRRVSDLADVLGLKPVDMVKPVKALSGGMKSKLEIIRSLMHKPQVLFLDEPTSALDPLSRKTLWEYLATIRKKDGTTIFLTTHYLEEAEGSDRVCVLNTGKIVALGTPAQIKKQYAAKHLSLEQAYLNIIQETS
jgi:ABC-2 type transport system ATP-binding protein